MFVPRLIIYIIFKCFGFLFMQSFCFFQYKRYLPRLMLVCDSAIFLFEMVVPVFYFVIVTKMYLLEFVINAMTIYILVFLTYLHFYFLWLVFLFVFAFTLFLWLSANDTLKSIDFGYVIFVLRSSIILPYSPLQLVYISKKKKVMKIATNIVTKMVTKMVTKIVVTKIVVTTS